MNTENKTLAEIFTKFEEMVLPSLLVEITEQLAEANSYREAMQRVTPALKATLYMGCEVYQAILNENIDNEAKLERLKGIQAEIEAFVEETMARKKLVRH